MQENVKIQINSFLRKIVAIAFLPILITTWMTGWVLIQIGRQWERSKINQKTLPTPRRSKLQKAKSELSNSDNEESKLLNKPLIAT